MNHSWSFCLIDVMVKLWKGSIKQRISHTLWSCSMRTSLLLNVFSRVTHDFSPQFFPLLTKGTSSIDGWIRMDWDRERRGLMSTFLLHSVFPLIWRIKESDVRCRRWHGWSHGSTSRDICLSAVRPNRPNKVSPKIHHSLRVRVFLGGTLLMVYKKHLIRNIC